MKSRRPPGVGWLIWGWLLLVLACAGGIPMSRILVEIYEPGLIEVRPWMVHYNYVMSFAHLISMSVLFAGALLFLRHRLDSVLAWSALLALFATLLSIASMFVFPFFYGWGPWPEEAREVAFLKSVVLLPGAIRTVGCVLLAAALLRFSSIERTGLFRFRDALMFFFMAVDLVLAIYKWTITPKTVVAVLHPFQQEPLLMGAFFAGALFFSMMLFEMRRESGI